MRTGAVAKLYHKPTLSIVLGMALHNVAKLTSSQPTRFLPPMTAVREYVSYHVACGNRETLIYYLLGMALHIKNSEWTYVRS